MSEFVYDKILIHGHGLHLQSTLASLAPSLHSEFSLCVLKLNVKRAPVMSMIIEEPPSDFIAKHSEMEAESN